MIIAIVKIIPVVIMHDNNPCFLSIRPIINPKIKNETKPMI